MERCSEDLSSQDHTRVSSASRFLSRIATRTQDRREVASITSCVPLNKAIPSVEHTFIQNRFIQMTFPSKFFFIRSLARKRFTQTRIHPETLASKHTFVEKVGSPKGGGPKGGAPKGGRPKILRFFTLLSHFRSFSLGGIVATVHGHGPPQAPGGNAQFGWSMAATRGHNSTSRPLERKKSENGAVRRREVQGRGFPRKGWGKAEQRE